MVDVLNRQVRRQIIVMLPEVVATDGFSMFMMPEYACSVSNVVHFLAVKKSQLNLTVTVRSFSSIEFDFTFMASAS